MDPTYSTDRPESELGGLVEPSLERIGRLLERAQGDELRVCIILTRASERHFQPNGHVAVGVSFPGADDVDAETVKAEVDRLVIESLIGAAEQFAKAAGYPLTIIRPSSN